ncbi:MAG: DASS family sodium-coupled anion symporter [Phycisphaeraceae bacterium]|nr:DASS family sodium-coupled anion symporter [Phycisphaeraceae bacterium]
MVEKQTQTVVATDKSGTVRWRYIILALVLGTIAFLIMPGESLNSTGEVISGLSYPGRAVVAIAIFMATLWVCAALPVTVTALLPLVLFPLCTGGVISVKTAAAPYAHELIFLFMGGFMMSLAMQQWGLHRRLALHAIRLIGTKPTRLVAGLMVSCAFISMWVSNTATAVMMMPIALSVIELVRAELSKTGSASVPPPGKPFNFAICLMLGIAYAASIGGIGTLIGTPPNALMAAFLMDNYETEISFAKWAIMTCPLVAVFLPIVWLLLTKVIFPIRIQSIPGGQAFIHKELQNQGPLSRGEFMVLIVFVVTAVAWMTRPLLVQLTLPGGLRPLAGLSDPGIAMSAALVLFCLPVDLKRGVFALTWEQARKLPWGILILFGGGLSLATAFKTSGVTEFIGRSVSEFDHLPTWAMVLLACSISALVSELTSNTASTAILLPIFAAVAEGFGINPLLMIVPATIGASFAFMMPVATPPNALVFASGEISISHMCKAGVWLNIVGIILVMLHMYFIVSPVLMP